jgi:hypothetical protein
MDKSKLIERLEVLVEGLNLLAKEMKVAGVDPHDIFIYGRDGNSNGCRIEETDYDGVNLKWYASEYCEF